MRKLSINKIKKMKDMKIWNYIDEICEDFELDAILQNKKLICRDIKEKFEISPEDAGAIFDDWLEENKRKN